MDGNEITIGSMLWAIGLVLAISLVASLIPEKQ